MDEEAIYAVYAELFAGLERLGPGSRASTLAALACVGEALPRAPAVADMGCGHGAATTVLAAALPQARFMAVDLDERFVDAVRSAARSAGCGERVTAVAGDMGAPQSLGLAPASFDLIWAEASAYAIGVERALAAWKPLLRPNGRLVFSELIWTLPVAARPAQCAAFWRREYPAMGTGEDVANACARAGFEVLQRRRQPPSDWRAYYAPLRERVARMREHAEAGSVAAMVLAGMEEEIALFDEDGATSYAYEMFVTRT